MSDIPNTEFDHFTFFHGFIQQVKRMPTYVRYTFKNALEKRETYCLRIL